VGFKKKKAVSRPQPIQFVRITLRNVFDVAEWCGGTAAIKQDGQQEPRLVLGDEPAFIQGDYIVRHADGSFAGLIPEVFDMFYEVK